MNPLQLLFPNRCLECNRIISSEEVVCGLCYDQIHFTHNHLSENNLLKEKCSLLFPVENAVALLQFEKENLSRKIVHQLKYGNREKIGKILANWTLEKTDVKNLIFDVLVTVPLHPKKLRKRGYNQLHLYAETLSKELRIPFDHTLIRRNFHKKAQAKRSRKEREATQNLFSITKEISGKHILLIDDVFTTGNTISSIAWEILKYPNNTVSVLMIATD
ncbi:ComF family protein [Kaistella montana]|uniref:ComF family protein n=1 Tax=Kaistella montana TaxID=1849733 RepID=A0ABW5K816_9FLAO|nr:phosphoribosyltransferase family protein [Kaistella montana]MCQ4035273.1 ComF family protein [Kaistella montana]